MNDNDSRGMELTPKTIKLPYFLDFWKNLISKETLNHNNER